MQLDTLRGALTQAVGLADEDKATLAELISVWWQKRVRNNLRDRYFTGHVALKDLGVAIPDDLAQRINPRIDWAKKAVMSLANRSQFDGFTSADEDTDALLRVIVENNQLKTQYRRNCIGELKHCCGFWTVTADEVGNPVIRSYPAISACAIWDDEMKSIKAGLAVVKSQKLNEFNAERTPTLVHMYTADNVIELRYIERKGWQAEYMPHSMGRPLMEAMPYEPTLERPFGQSRISRAVMSIVDDAVREKARSEIAAELAALPGKYALGVDEPIEGDDRYSAAMGVMLSFTNNGDDEKPTVGQFPQLSMQPHTDYMRSLACQFSGATNVPLSSLGVVSDNPSSAEAIYAAKEDLVIDAQNLNADNAIALKNVALMALAIYNNTDFATQVSDASTVQAKFRNPAMPSVVSQSDAIVKQVSAIPWIGQTNVALEELGYTDEQIQRMNADKRKAEAAQRLAEAQAQVEAANA